MTTKKTSSKKKSQSESLPGSEEEKNKSGKKAGASAKPRASKKSSPSGASTKKRAKSKKNIAPEPEEEERSFAPVVVPPKTEPKKVEPIEEEKKAPVVSPSVKQAPQSTPQKSEPVVEKKSPAVSPPPPKKKNVFPRNEGSRPPSPSTQQPKPAPFTPAKHSKPVSTHKHRAPVEDKPSVSTATLTRAKIRFNEMMTVKDFASALKIPVADTIKKLLTLGSPATINQRLEKETAQLLAESYDVELEFRSIYSEDKNDVAEDPANLKSRSPVVTVMGHVDHGKTSLLDAIRSSRVVEKEAGGITQHIGAYQVKAEKGSITFLDTPGHEAFTAMRARGAQVTDLVVLVVAADDSVMPQTIEAIDHAKAANVPIIVAINKCDLPQANVQKVKQELSGHNLLAEDWGGKTVMVEVSAKTGKNLDKLIEMILLETELLELKANPDRTAKGAVLEAKKDPKRGVLASILIQQGTMKVGDILVCGLTSGRVRAMLDEYFKPVDEAGPSRPVAILGLDHIPQVGDQVLVVQSEREAREIAERRREFMKDSMGQGAGHLSLETLHSQIEEGKLQELKIILKADVQGSLQAIQDALGKLSGSTIQIRFVHCAVGNINESDVLLAEAADAVVFGFSVSIEGSAETEAKRGKVDVRTYKIIYEMLADVRAAMEGLLKPVELEAIRGRAIIKTVFSTSKFGKVAGCLVQEGKIIRGNKARVLRGTVVVGSGSITTLRRFKDDVKEVEKGYECGLSVDGVNNIAAGDLVESFVIEKKTRRLEN